MNVWAVEHFFSSELDRGLSANLILMKKMFNCSEAHSERSNFLQNPYFKYQRKKVALTFSKKNSNSLFSFTILSHDWRIDILSFT